MVQVVRFEAGDICGNLESGITQILIELVISRLSCPFKNTIHTFVNEGLCIFPFKSAQLFVLEDQGFCCSGKNFATSDQGFNPGLVSESK